MGHGAPGEPGADPAATQEPQRWTADGIGGEYDNWHIYGEAGNEIAVVWARTDGKTELPARLMAAAPTMLAALEKTLVAFENAMPKHLYKNGCFNWETQPDDCACTAHRIRAAIAQAAS